MQIIFTLCSNNYLPQALVLLKSVQLHQPSWKFIIGLVDHKDETIAYDKFGCDVIEANVVEPAINSLAEKYSIIELNTCLKPTFFQYFFEFLKADKVIYMDPDLCLYSPMFEVEDGLEDHDFILTPHILTPIPLDDYTPNESLFLNYGLYNLGFLALKKSFQTAGFLNWWKERTYLKGYDKPALGLFTDQLWINLVPLFYNKVNILRHSGYNMAPWNIHERMLGESDGCFQVNSKEPLVFFHFSSFNPVNQKFHKEYSRFEWEQRPDLHHLFNEYRAGLESENYRQYMNVPCHYVKVRKKFLALQQSLLQEEQAKIYGMLPMKKKIIKKIKRNVPVAFKNFLLNLISS